MRAHTITDTCKEHDAQLLYLVKFGSHLYGTSTKKSDTDYKGIFLPSMDQCLLETAPKSITRNSSGDREKNKAEDVDIQLWSLQYFLQLLGKGEVNALDLAYSWTNKSVVEYMHPDIKPMLTEENLRRLFNVADCNAFVGYAIGQAKKYGIKGSRMGVLKEAIKITNEYMQTLGEDSGSVYLSSKFSTIGELIGIINYQLHDDSYCFIKRPFLCLCGKMHQDTITVEEFYNRIREHYQQYGDRAEKARKNEGVDFKALSHAVRCLRQMEELILTGMIKFPLQSADYLLAIKEGRYGFTDIEMEINAGIDSVKEKLAAGPERWPFLKKKKDQKYINNFILSCYDY
jgi:hypothetical protein